MKMSFETRIVSSSPLIVRMDINGVNYEVYAYVDDELLGSVTVTRGRDEDVYKLIETRYYRDSRTTSDPRTGQLLSWCKKNAPDERYRRFFDKILR